MIQLSAVFHQRKKYFFETPFLFLFFFEQTIQQKGIINKKKCILSQRYQKAQEMKIQLLTVGFLLLVSAQATYYRQECQNNSYWNGQKCVCSYGFDNLNGKCVSKCGENQVWAGLKCYCDSGYKSENYKCVPICNKPYEHFQKPNQCVCDKGFKRDHYNQCVPDCGPHEIIKGYECVCEKGFKRNAYGDCEIQCGEHEIVKGYECVCEKGFGKDHYGVCIPECGRYERWDGNECVCTHSFKRDSEGNCVSKYYSNYKY